MGFYDFYKTYTLRKKILTKSVSPPPQKKVSPPPFASPPPPENLKSSCPPQFQNFQNFQPPPPLQRGGGHYEYSNKMTIHDLTFSYHFGKSDKNQRVSRPLEKYSIFPELKNIFTFFHFFSGQSLHSLPEIPTVPI